MITITVMYACRACDVFKVKLNVPARPEHGMDVRVWMDQTVKLIVQHHRSLFPDCRAHELNDLMIPIENAEWVGGPAIQ